MSKSTRKSSLTDRLKKAVKGKAKPPAKKKKPATPTSVPPATVKSGIGSAGPPGSATGAAAIESLRRTVRQFKADVRSEFQGVAGDIQKLRQEIGLLRGEPGAASGADPQEENRPGEPAEEEEHPSIAGGLDAAVDDDYHGRTL